MTERPTTRGFRRLLRLPSFGVALGMSLAVLVTFAAWMFIDASFDVTLEVARIDLGLQEHPGVDMSETHHWDQLGSRLALLAVLALSGALATLLVFYRILFGHRRGRSLCTLFLAVALVGLWLALGVSHEKLQSAGFQWRLHRTVQRLKPDAAVLATKWPTTSGVLPYLGAYTVTDDNPHFLWLRSEYVMYSSTEDIGRFVTRTENGAILLDYVGEKIEFHPDGSKPADYTQVVRQNGQVAFQHRWFVDHYVELEPNWFHVTYLTDIPDAADETAEP